MESCGGGCRWGGKAAATLLAAGLEKIRGEKWSSLGLPAFAACRVHRDGPELRQKGAQVLLQQGERLGLNLFKPGRPTSAVGNRRWARGARRDGENLLQDTLSWSPAPATSPFLPELQVCWRWWAQLQR